MKKILTLCFIVITSLCFACSNGKTNIKNNTRNLQSHQINIQTVSQLAQLPIDCIQQEYPNKTGHSIDGSDDARLSPSELHPSFYGCFDWHSSVHGHWLLVKALKLYPNIPERNTIISILNSSFQEDKIKAEADYFSKYSLGALFERTYGWAWVLKLDEELSTWEDSLAQVWHKNLQPLTLKIVQLWKDYLPKQTYPNRTGVHPNTAFGLAFAMDWAQHKKDEQFFKMLRDKSISFYEKNTAIAAIQEPDGSDFFSPSLYVAELMTRIYDQARYVSWFDQYFTKEGLDNVCTLPIVSDRNDYQIVHLDGLILSRAWNMKIIADKLPDTHPWKSKLQDTSLSFLDYAMEQLSKSNYGGQHWLGSFAMYALTR